MRLAEKLSADNSLQDLPPCVWAQRCLPKTYRQPSPALAKHTVLAIPINTSWIPIASQPHTVADDTVFWNRTLHVFFPGLQY